MLNLRKIGKKAVLRKVRASIDPRYRVNLFDHGVINFIDIGSIGGLPPPWDRHAYLIKFLLNFEPNDKPVHTRNVVTYPTAVWKDDAVRPFYIYKGAGGLGSSLLEQNIEYVRENWSDLKTRGPSGLANTWFERSELARTVQIQCRALDSIIAGDFPRTSFHFLKIDAQGGEFAILQGARQLLQSTCIGLHLELFVLPLYKQMALLEQVSRFLAEFGYVLAKKFPPHGTFDSQHDCVFLHPDRNPTIAKIISKAYSITDVSKSS